MSSSRSSADHINSVHTYSTHNYSPVKVVAARALGSWVWDVEGKKYFDMMSAYSAINFGHNNPRFVARAKAQLDQMTMVSRAFLHDQLGPFSQELADLCGMEMVLPMNSGAEAVETAIKCARKWGYEVKGVPEGKAEIICMSNNFAGRTVTIISFSTEPLYQKGFTPLTPGFVIAEYGNIDSFVSCITPHTVAVLLEPIQGEGGIIIPPDGYLAAVRDLCAEHELLFVADEIQTGLCRTGERFACDHEEVKPDLMVLAKSLGGGITPISALIGPKKILEVFTPGSHGSTFGGNSFACAIAREVIAYIREERPERWARELGAHIEQRLRSEKLTKVAEIRARGLMVGIDIQPHAGKGKKYCEELAARGVLCKDTREQTLRLTPPLTSTKSDIDWALDKVIEVLR